MADFKLSYTAEEVDELLTRVKNGGFDPAQYGLPILYLTGDTSAMTKDNAVDLQYVYGDKSGTASVKWQGSSSLSYPKKNYTIKFNNAFEAHDGWGEQKKYCLKANFIDHSHARNVVCAKLWGEIVKSRASYTDVFDISKVTAYLNMSGVSRDIPTSDVIISEDGILTVNLSDASFGPAFLNGTSFKRGTYTITFDLLIPHDSTTDPRGAVTITFSVPGPDVETDAASKTVRTIVRQEWTTLSATVEVLRDDSLMSIIPGGSVELTQNMGYQFRNITVVGENEYTNNTDVLKQLTNGGAIDGFPCVIMLNDEFHGLYTFNIPKDGWMFGMSDPNLQQAIVCANTHSTATKFKEPATLTESDFEVEYASDENNTDWIKTSLNTLISAVANSDGTNLDTVISKYLDWESAIDYYILVILLRGDDMTDKNYLLATYDGTKWFFSAYDMDSVYGLHWNGKSIISAMEGPSFGGYAASHKVMELVKTYKLDKLKERYAEIRKTIMSEDNVALAFLNFVGLIPTVILDEDVRKWPTIPSSSVSNVSQILNWYRLRVAAIDKEIENL